MPLDTLARFRVGFQYYVKYRAKTGFSITPATTTDPSITLPTSLVGICSKPAWNQNENQQPVTGVGIGRPLGYVPGRRECDWSTRILVSDANFLACGFRNHSVPGSTKGMTPLDLTWGVCSDYTGDSQTRGAVDAQFNNLSFEVSENQPMTAQVDLWPMAFCSAAAQALAGAVPTNWGAVPIVWQGISWGPSAGGVISTDYHPRLSQVRVQLGHALQRVGCRKVYGTGGVEYNISRTAYAINPTVETLRISYQLHDDVPSELWPVFDSGQITLYGEAVGVGAGRNTVTLTIDHNYMDRRSSGELQANAMYTASAEMVGHAVALAKGTTSG